MGTMPDWFGPALISARHQDYLEHTFVLFRWFHRVFRRNCPACRWWHDSRRPLKSVERRSTSGNKRVTQGTKRTHAKRTS